METQSDQINPDQSCSNSAGCHNEPNDPKDPNDHLIRAEAQYVFDLMAKRVPLEEVLLLHRAFDFAYEAHKGQKRKSGEPYIIHPVKVARITAEELMLGTNSVCAAFLHDVVEDTDYSLQDIEKRFGKDIDFLVDVVTKKPDKGNPHRQVENYQQILQSVKFDIRALLIKTADRLHNMRTLGSMEKHKQMKTAGETDFFYAPLANRLGLYTVKTELENLSFRYRCPREYYQMVVDILTLQKKDRRVVETFMEQIEGIFKDNDIEARVEVEYRQPFNIRRKMKKYDMDFDHVEGKRFFRIVFASDTTPNARKEKETALRIYSLLTEKMQEKPKSIVNYISSPKDNGYQSLHLKLLNSIGQWEEIHISSERMRRVSRLGVIADRQENNIARWINNLKDKLQDMAQNSQGIDFMEGVETSFYNDDIVVFTPKGDPIILPQGATVLDFAFEIHTEIGLKAKYAKVNGKLVNILTRLNRGDCVEVGTSEDSHPQEFWLDHLKNYKAKKSIRAYLATIPKKTVIRCPHCCPIPEDEVIGIEDDNKVLTIHRRDCTIAIRDASEHGDKVKAFELKADDTLYPVEVHILAVDRTHMLAELIECITNELHLPIASVNTRTQLNIVQIKLRFEVHSYKELNKVITTLKKIPGVDEVGYTTKLSEEA